MTRPNDRPAADDGTATFAKQGTIAFGGNILKKVLGFGIIAVITRLVSPSVYGLFVLATSLVLLLQTLATLGLPKAIDYFVPQYRAEGRFAEARGVVVQALGITLVASVATAVLLAAVAETLSRWFGEPSLYVALLLLLVALPLLAVYNVLLACFSAIKQLKYRVYTRDLVRPTVRFGATVALLFAGYGLLGVLGGYVAGLLVCVVVGSVLFVRNAPDIVGADTKLVPTRPLLAYATPLAVAGIVHVVLGQIDYFIIGAFGTTDGVGIYRVGYMIASNLLVVFVAVAPIFKPLVAEARHDDAAVIRHYRNATRWVTGLTLPLAIVIALGAEAYLSLIFTPQYAAATTAVGILVIGFLINVAFGGPDGTLLQGLGYSRLVLLNSALLLGINAVGSALLVPVIGITGAAIGSALSLAVVGVAALVQVYYLRGIHPFTMDLWRVLAAGVPATAAGAAVVLLSPWLVVVAVVLPIVVMGVYVGSILAFDGLVEADVELAAQFGPAAEQAVAAAVD